MSFYRRDHHWATVSAYYALNLNRFDMNYHVHGSCEIMYVVAGRCTVATEQGNFILGERQFVFLDENLPHCLRVDAQQPCTLLNVEFSCRTQAGEIDLRGLASHPDMERFLAEGRSPLLLYDDRKMGFALKDLIAEMDKKAEADPALLQLLFCRMLLELVKCPAGAKRAAGIRHLKKAVRYIDEHIYENITVPMVARHTGVNHAYLQTLFSLHYHMGIMAYVNHQRMEHASFLLRNSAMGVTDLAFHLGFNSRQHFGYTFEKQFGMSPRQYRKLHGQAIAADTGAVQWRLTDDGRYDACPLTEPVPGKGEAAAENPDRD